MSLLDQIQKHQIAAQKQRDELVLSTLRLLTAEIHNHEIDKHAPLTDEEVEKIISQQIKKRQEATQLYRQGNRPELAQREEKEAQVLSKYLPPQMSPEELTQTIRKIIKDQEVNDPVNFGQVMKQVMSEVKGRAPGDKIATLVKQFLSQA